MKKFFVLLVVAFVMTNAYSQRKPKIKGNKNVIEVREDLSAFTAISLVDDLDVVLQKSSQEGYSLELDDNLVDVLKFKVVDSVLKISSFYNITSKKKLKIIIFFQELNELTMTNGSISMKDVISSDRLTVNTSGGSKLELNATADIIDIYMNDNSGGDFNVASDSLNITLKDRIDVKIYATGSQSSLYQYNNSSIKLDGTGDFLMAKLYGNSTLKAEDYQVNEVLLLTQDSPNAKIRAVNDFQLSSKGSAKTSLYGNPMITILDFLDTSKLEKEKD